MFGYALKQHEERGEPRPSRNFDDEDESELPRAEQPAAALPPITAVHHTCESAPLGRKCALLSNTHCV